MLLEPDTNSGYWRKEAEKEDTDKTAFVPHHGLYRFVGVPSGLKNAPETFQQTMIILLANLNYQYDLSERDEIMITMKKPERNIKHVRQFIELLSRG